MEYILISLCALAASALTLFSGFGLGTLLMPVFALFFPIEIAIALTAIVHFLNNLFKLILMGKNAVWSVVARFGIPSFLFAFAGAFLLVQLGHLSSLGSYSIGSQVYHIGWLKLIIGVLMVIFALFDLLPRLSALQFNPRYLISGGALSGFFGGLSGHQGALRSAFLSRLQLTKEQFIGTGVVIACMVDISRLGVYAGHVGTYSVHHAGVLIVATLSAFCGAYFGTRLLKKVTYKTVQTVVGVLLLLIALLLMAGII